MERKSFTDPGEGQAATPRATIAGVFPFVLVGLMMTLQAVDYHAALPWLGHSVAPYLVVHAVLLVGLGIGWALRFPRWSYAYLGMALIATIMLADVATPGFHLFGHTFGRELWGWRAWAPLLALAVVMLLVTRSAQPLAQLVRGVRRDWTRLSFALYAVVTWLMLLVLYDGKSWYNQTLYLPLNMFLLTLVMSGGALFYMRGRRSWSRALALECALLLFIPTAALIAGLDGHDEFGSPATVGGWLAYLLLWLVWLSPPLWPGLVNGVWLRARPA